ncbi:metal-dependent hydrolase [Paenibacillus abyssi]|uniref:Metal-dependent hydrolase n=1 Tax=Paenibacillus abyssi TaxID=1340531 RepID=A0A917CNU7_9BACL|nr:metal-dependent hydrolase [Paenibacillus abyssi]GGF92812.1 hypothetical protein GCM10010916_07720 [Paenibacillus abyssi]
MKGSTHFAIGVIIGGAAAAVYPFSLTNAAMYMSVAGFSALAADLDGPSLLSSGLGKVSKLLRELGLWIGILMLASIGYFYFTEGNVYPELTSIAVMIAILGMVTKEGVVRNALVSVIGIGFLYTGLQSGLNWLMGFGLFVAWVPWLKHRGMSHTIWAVILWGAIGAGLENHLRIEGIMMVATAGYASHLLADTLTPSGIKWFYPLYKKSIKLN